MTDAIYTAYHRAAPRIESASIVPIHVGRAGASAPIPDMIGDDTGDHISDRNAAWCELTALYWAWKNDRETGGLVGLMHYRRVLDLTDRAPGGAVEATEKLFDIAQWCGEAENWLKQSGDDWDLVVPRLHKMGRTVEANYKAGHAPQDWDILRDVVLRDHPDYAKSFEAVAGGYDVRLGNIALMRRPLFDRYCTWLFDVLFAVEAADLDRTHYSAQQARYLGYLAERLLTVFVYHEQQANPDLRVREVSILNLSQALVWPYIGPKDAPRPEAVNLALAADRLYLPHAAAMLRSVLDHADPERPINIFFLHSGLSPHDLQVLESMLALRPDTVLHALDTGGWFDDSYRSASRAPSNATYNRFLLFLLLPGVQRLLYLDADVIVQGDICTLFDTDLGGAQLGAVPDWIMTRTLTGATRTIDPDVPELGEYHRQKLGLTPDQIARYFNAGVLLFDFAAMGDLKALGADLMEQARGGQYLFRDQDILNMAFKDSYKVLDPRWNVFNSLPASYGRVPRSGLAQAMAARRAPLLVHYADRDHKPWTAHPVPHAGLYWQALIRTPFYAEVVAALGAPVIPLRRGGTLVRIGRTLAERVPVLKGPLLRLYAWLRK